MPNAPMWLNVSHTTDWVSLQPGLRWPGVPGLRVEVNGQVRCMIDASFLKVGVCTARNSSIWLIIIAFT